jgi:acetyl-CoA carboxylase biotin carboxyl carrier protein
VTATRDLVAIADGTALRAPAPGWFLPAVASDHLIAPGDVLGELDVLGHVARVVAPRVHGLAKLPASVTARRAVGYGDVLVTLAPLAAGAGELAAAPEAAAARAAEGLVFRAPSSGRFYIRPAPDKPAFVTAGQELVAGTTVCLLEVMKTFNRVTYGGADVPPRARVREVLVADGADVNAGDPLIALDP